MKTQSEKVVGKDHKCPVCGKEIDLKKRLGKIEKGFTTIFTCPHCMAVVEYTKEEKR